MRLARSVEEQFTELYDMSQSGVNHDAIIYCGSSHHHMHTVEETLLLADSETDMMGNVETVASAASGTSSFAVNVAATEFCQNKCCSDYDEIEILVLQ